MPPKRTKQAKSAVLYMRVTPEFKALLTEVATRFGEPAEVVRKVLEAFTDGRVTIVPPPPDEKETLYNARTEN